MPDFYSDFERVLRAAFEYGTLSVTLRSDLSQPFTDVAQNKKFLGACHRGFEKAQHSVIKMLKENSSDTRISEYERDRRELLLRKIIDGIIFTMLKQRTYVIRRLSLHDSAPNLDFKVIDRALEVVDRLNAEDRLTFAVLADLSTFVHICDVVRINMRESNGKVSFIELKEGRVNEIISKHLEKHPPIPSSLDEIKLDSNIEPRHKEQAKRVQKQRIRLKQTDDILRDDKGTDIRTNLPFRLNSTLIDEESYEKTFSENAEQAIDKGLCSFTVNFCLHFGMSSSAEIAERINQAKKAAYFELYETHRNASGKLQELYQANDAPTGLKKVGYKLTDVVQSQLTSIPVKPLFCWGISKKVRSAIIENRLSIYCVVDLPALMYAAHAAGLIPSLSTRKEAAKLLSGLGPHTAPDYDGRVVRIEHPEFEGEQVLLGGAYSRFANNLQSPYSYFLSAKKHWTELFGNKSKGS